MRASLFITCLGDTLFPDVGIATVKILERLGVKVDFPAEQTCCGQMHVNTGYGRQALPLVRRFVQAFGQAEAIVTPSGSCAAMVVGHYPRLAREAGDQRLAAEAESVAERVHELSRFLVEVLDVEDVGARFPHRVTYHASCHAMRMMHVGDAPLRLLRRVEAIHLIELSEAETCCGFGGTFAVKNAAMSSAMLTDKIGNVLATGAEVLTAPDSSCLMHIGGGLRRLNAGVRVMHVAEILAANGASA
jgi:L-lactate dehydrogenase complex protein LldE